MTPFSLASSAISGSCWGTTRDIVLPTSSRKPLGTRSAAPMTVANTATARMTTMTPMTNCQAHNGMAFGHLFLAALTQQEGSFLRAVEEASRLLKLRGRVLPVTLYNTHLCAELEDGTIVEEEVQVRAVGKARIKRIFLKDDSVSATPGSVEAIAAADLITIGPGSLYTAVCACLLVPEIARAIATAAGLVVYVANTTR